MRAFITLGAAAVALFANAAQAQQGPPQFPNMTFFISSAGGPNGAN